LQNLNKNCFEGHNKKYSEYFPSYCMGKKLPQKSLELYKAVDQILFEEWDPIGVHGASSARDEYYAYLPRAYQLAIENNTQGLLDYLFWVEKARMGLRGNQKNCERVVTLILEKKNEIGL
jgi:hypothetical protein